MSDRLARLLVSAALLALASAGFTFAGSVAFDALNAPLAPVVCHSKAHCKIAARLPAGLPGTR